MSKIEHRVAASQVELAVAVRHDEATERVAQEEGFAVVEHEGTWSAAALVLVFLFASGTFRALLVPLALLQLFPRQNLGLHFLQLDEVVVCRATGE